MRVSDGDKVRPNFLKESLNNPTYSTQKANDKAGGGTQKDKKINISNNVT